jgi:hypothetical protein
MERIKRFGAAATCLAASGFMALAENTNVTAMKGIVDDAESVFGSVAGLVVTMVTFWVAYRIVKRVTAK